MDEKIYTLTDKIDKDLINAALSGKEKQNLVDSIKKLLPEDAIALAQINPTSGNVKNNAIKAYEWIKWAQMLELDAIVFPEMYLIGYPIGDFIDRFPIVVEENIEWLNALASVTTGKTKVIMGFVEFNKTKGGKKYFNSIAVLSKGKIERIIRKTLLPNYAEFNDYRHFEPSAVDSANRITTTGKNKAGIIVCLGWMNPTLRM